MHVPGRTHQVRERKNHIRGVRQVGRKNIQTNTISERVLERIKRPSARMPVLRHAAHVSPVHTPGRLHQTRREADDNGDQERVRCQNDTEDNETRERHSEQMGRRPESGRRDARTSDNTQHPYTTRAQESNVRTQNKQSTATAIQSKATMVA